MVLDTDPYGNFLLQGYEQGSGRDWARLANLYLQDGALDTIKVPTLAVWRCGRQLRSLWMPFPAWTDRSSA